LEDQKLLKVLASIGRGKTIQNDPTDPSDPNTPTQPRLTQNDPNDPNSMAQASSF
jgi:hypothetical protein